MLQVLDTIAAEVIVPRVLKAKILVQILGLKEEKHQNQIDEKTREEINNETLLSLYVADLQ